MNEEARRILELVRVYPYYGYVRTELVHRVPNEERKSGCTNEAIMEKLKSVLSSEPGLEHEVMGLIAKMAENHRLDHSDPERVDAYNILALARKKPNYDFIRNNSCLKKQNKFRETGFTNKDINKKLLSVKVFRPYLEDEVDYLLGRLEQNEVMKKQTANDRVVAILSIRHKELALKTYKKNYDPKGTMEDVDALIQRYLKQEPHMKPLFEQNNCGSCSNCGKDCYEK